MSIIKFNKQEKTKEIKNNKSEEQILEYPEDEYTLQRLEIEELEKLKENQMES